MLLLFAGPGLSFDANPLLLGRPIVGRPLLVSSGTLSTGAAVDGVQWRTCNSDGSGAANITGLTTYTADTPNSEGSYLVVRSTKGGTTADSNIVGPILPNFN